MHIEVTNDKTAENYVTDEATVDRLFKEWDAKVFEDMHNTSHLFCDLINPTGAVMPITMAISHKYKWHTVVLDFADAPAMYGIYRHFDYPDLTVKLDGRRLKISHINSESQKLQVAFKPLLLDVIGHLRKDDFKPEQLYVITVNNDVKEIYGDEISVELKEAVDKMLLLCEGQINA
jgi:hypothetical protein